MRYSVITINYNNSVGLRKTILSVINQTYAEFEYIVIDGGSTDNSLDFIKKYTDKIDYWVSEKDNGIYHAMNKGVSVAQGDYCIFINSGDSFYDRDTLQRLDVNIHNEDVIVGKVVDYQNNIVSPPPRGNFTLYHLYWGAIPHQGSIIKTELLRKNPYDESLKVSSDWKFFVQVLILNNGSLRYLDEFVARYDLSGYSSNNLQLMRQEKDSFLNSIFPPRVLADYLFFKQSECLTQSLTPLLKTHYKIDRILYGLGVLMLKIRKFL